MPPLRKLLNPELLVSDKRLVPRRAIFDCLNGDALACASYNVDLVLVKAERSPDSGQISAGRSTAKAAIHTPAQTTNHLASF